MNKNELDGILALKIVAEKRSFAAAAALLDVTPSAVSQIVKLETRIGLALLTRTTRSVTLTEVGEQFLAQVGPAVDQILSAVTSAGSYAAKPSGLLRINMPKMIFSSFLSPIIASF